MHATLARYLWVVMQHYLGIAVAQAQRDGMGIGPQVCETQDAFVELSGCIEIPDLDHHAIALAHEHILYRRDVRRRTRWKQTWSVCQLELQPIGVCEEQRVVTRGVVDPW